MTKSYDENPFVDTLRKKYNQIVQVHNDCGPTEDSQLE